MAEGEKMSKSLGNFYTVHDLLQEFPGEAIRLTLLKTHYRQPLDFTKDGIREAKRELDGFYGVLRRCTNVDARPDDKDRTAGFLDTLNDDLNTPNAISHLHTRVNELNLRLLKPEDNPQLTATYKWVLLECGKLLGLLQQDPEEWFKWQPPTKAGGMSDAEIDALIAERVAARQAKDFARADEIRGILTAEGIAVEDSAEGATWRRI